MLPPLTTIKWPHELERLAAVAHQSDVTRSPMQRHVVPRPLNHAHRHKVNWIFRNVHYQCGGAAAAVDP